MSLALLSDFFFLVRCLYNKQNDTWLIKTSEKNWTQYFDDSMSSFSSEKRIKFDNLYTIYIK